MLIRSVCLAVALSLSMAVAAETDADEAGETSRIEEVVVHGSRLPEAQGFSDPEVSVLSAESIALRNPLDTVELLRPLPGVFIARQGGPGGVASLYTRGGEPNFTAIHINGVQVNNAADTRGGAFDFSNLDADLIQRVELVRGPRSAVYGSDALSGAINIVTAGGPAQAESRISLGAGERGQRSGGYRVGGPILGARGAIGYTSTDYGELVEGYTLDTRTLTTSVARTAEQTSWSLDVIRTEFDRTAFPEDSGGPERATRNLLDTASGDELIAAATLDHEINEYWTLKVLAGWYDRFEDFDSPGVPFTQVPPFGDETDFRRSSIGVVNELSLPGTIDLAAGVDFRREETSNEGYVKFSGSRFPTEFALVRNVYAGFLEVRKTFDQLALSASVRHDSPQGFNARTTWQLGASYRPAGSGTQVSVSWGEGFKLPSMFALGSSLVGNPDLRPETSRGYSLTLQQELGGGAVSLTGFRSAYRDLIDFDPESFVNLNRSRVDIDGAELQMHWSWSELVELNASATYLDADLQDQFGALRGRPQWLASTSLAWRVHPRLSLKASVRWVDEVLQSSLVTGFMQLDSYAVANFGLAWQAASRLSVDLALDNLADARYREAVGVPSPGRQLRGKLVYRMLH